MYRIILFVASVSLRWTLMFAGIFFQCQGYTGVARRTQICPCRLFCTCIMITIHIAFFILGSQKGLFFRRVSRAAPAAWHSLFKEVVGTRLQELANAVRVLFTLHQCDCTWAWSNWFNNRFNEKHKTNVFSVFVETFVFESITMSSAWDPNW